MRRQQRFGEPCHRMLTEVGGNIADTQPSSGRSVDGELWIDRRERSSTLAIPVAVFGEDRFGGQVAAVVEREQQIAVRDGIVGRTASASRQQLSASACLPCVCNAIARLESTRWRCCACGRAAR